MNFLTVLLEGAPVLTQTADKAANESLNIIDLAMKGGWIMVVLALLSVVGAYIFFERFMALRKSMEKDGRLNDRVKDNLMENDVKSAYNYCQKLNTPVSRMLAKGVKDFNLDSPSIRQALENTAALEIANLERIAVPLYNCCRCSNAWISWNCNRYGAGFLEYVQCRKQC